MCTTYECIFHIKYMTVTNEIRCTIRMYNLYLDIFGRYFLECIANEPEIHLIYENKFPMIDRADRA